MSKTLADFKALLAEHPKSVKLTREVADFTIFLYTLPDPREINLVLTCIDNNDEVFNMSYIAPGWTGRKRFLMETKFSSVTDLVQRIMMKSDIWKIFTGPMELSDGLFDFMDGEINSEEYTTSLDEVYDGVLGDFRSVEEINKLMAEMDAEDEANK